MQIVDLCQVLRGGDFPANYRRTFQMGQVIWIDTLEAYKAKLFGPRIRLLIQDLDTLPHAVILPRMDGEALVKYKLEISGLPNQCNR